MPLSSDLNGNRVKVNKNNRDSNFDSQLILVVYLKIFYYIVP
jgi:hypothetical protein